MIIPVRRSPGDGQFGFYSFSSDFIPDFINGFLYYGSIINGLIVRLGRENAVTQLKFEKCRRLIFEKSAALACLRWRPSHVDAGGQNGPLRTRFQAESLYLIFCQPRKILLDRLKISQNSSRKLHSLQIITFSFIIIFQYGVNFLF